MNNETSRRGASQAEAGFAAQLKSYYAHHWVTFKESWRRLWSAPVSTLLTWLLVGIALSLPSALYLVLQNAELVRSGWQGSAQLSVYLDGQLSEQNSQTLLTELQADPLVQAARYVSKQQAMEDFEALSGIQGVIEGFAENPLPASILLTLSGEALPSRSQQLAERIGSMPGVSDVQVDLQWLERLYQILLLGERVAWVLALLLAIAIVLVVGNTIRLSIENRREEILIVKLVGATAAYVQRPFIYFGLLFGLGGGLSCLLILLAGYWWIGTPMRALSEAYGSHFVLQGPSPLDAFLLLAFSTALGVLGAWTAVVRHLRDIEPK